MNRGACLIFLVQLSVVLTQLYVKDQLCPNTTNDTLALAHNCTVDYSRCDVEDLIHIDTDNFTYAEATTIVNVTFINNTKHETYYYRLCRGPAGTDNYDLVGCAVSNESFLTDLFWNMTGLNELYVAAYNDSKFANLVDCTHKRVLVANNSGVELHVKISQLKSSNIEPIILDRHTQPASKYPTCKTFNLKENYRIGNLTFVSSVNYTNYTTHFTYDFGDNDTLYREYSHSKESRVTHYYGSAGIYHCTVNAFVVLGNDESAVHDSVRKKVGVYETLTDHGLRVGDHNSVPVGVSGVTMKISGSFPIKYCWCLRLPNTTYCSPVPEIGNQTHTSKKGNITCTELTEPPENGQIIAWMNFTIPGLNGIMANLSNMVDCQMQGLNFTVYSPSPSPVAIISGATIGVLAALLALTLVTILIIVTVVIPYRRLKYKMTETANFRFIELSDSTATIRGRVRSASRSFVQYFRSNSEDKIGLVNTERESFTSSNRLINQGNKKVVRFAPYDSL